MVNNRFTVSLLVFLTSLATVWGCGLVSGLGEGDIEATTEGTENTSDESGGASAEGESTEGPPSLTYVTMWQLPVGTHRPEILVTDHDEILVAVVQPGETSEVGQIKHRVYHFDSSFNQIADPFPATYTTSEYGSPADHRTALVNGDLVMTYQTLLYGENGVYSCVGGPMEPCAESQSLLLARFSFDGTELFRAPIVAHATDFSQDSFPDHCILWQEDRLLVSTGITGGWGGPVKFREVDLEANILDTHTVTVTGSTIGNSLLDDGSRILFFSSVSPQTMALTSSELDSDFNLINEVVHADDSREQTFPTGNLFYNGFTYVAYISRAPTGSFDLSASPYYPYLKILDADQNVVDDFQVGEAGFSHTHPTLARIGNRLLFAWSRRVENANENAIPQVQVEEFEIE